MAKKEIIFDEKYFQSTIEDFKSKRKINRKVLTNNYMSCYINTYFSVEESDKFIVEVLNSENYQKPNKNEKLIQDSDKIYNYFTENYFSEIVAEIKRLKEVDKDKADGKPTAPRREDYDTEQDYKIACAKYQRDLNKWKADKKAKEEAEKKAKEEAENKEETK